MSKPPTSERLARAMEVCGAPIPPTMIERARAGYYDDYKSPLAFPLTQLVADLLGHGAHDLARRAKIGEFDGTEEEAEAWLQSEDGQQTLEAFRGFAGGSVTRRRE